MGITAKWTTGSTAADFAEQIDKHSKCTWPYAYKLANLCVDSSSESDLRRVDQQSRARGARHRGSRRGGPQLYSAHTSDCGCEYNIEL